MVLSWSNILGKQWGLHRAQSCVSRALICCISALCLCTLVLRRTGGGGWGGHLIGASCSLCLRLCGTAMTVTVVWCRCPGLYFHSPSVKFLSGLGVMMSASTEFPPQHRACRGEVSGCVWVLYVQSDQLRLHREEGLPNRTTKQRCCFSLV